MGDGKKLKEILDSKGINVRELSRMTGISHSSIYTSINRDSNIRFDYALRIANALDIDVNEICSASPFSGEVTEDEIYPTFPDGIHGVLENSRIKTYLIQSLSPLMHLFGSDKMPDIDNLLTSFYTLNDEARAEIIETIKIKQKFSSDPKRKEEIKNIQNWKSIK